MTFSEPELEVIGACFAYFQGRREQLKPNTRVAYYTTADTALKIVQEKTFWLRNPQLMNDYAEVVHGQQCLQAVLQDPEVLASASATIDRIYPGFFGDLVTSWVDSLNSNRPMPFVACLSEIHEDNDRGLLSMWRAYGGNNGIALVMRDALLDLDSNFINTFHSPVLYGGAPEVKAEILGILNNLAGASAAVTAAGRGFLKERLLIALEFAMLSIKHVGFSEEKEWRMVHHVCDESPHLKYRSVVVRGGAEVLCELNLGSHEALAPGIIIEKVIVGPCAFPLSTAQAMFLAFQKAGSTIPNIVTSDIPLRHM